MGVRSGRGALVVGVAVVGLATAAVALSLAGGGGTESVRAERARRSTPVSDASVATTSTTTTEPSGTTAAPTSAPTSPTTESRSPSPTAAPGPAGPTSAGPGPTVPPPPPPTEGPPPTLCGFAGIAGQPYQVGVTVAPSGMPVTVKLWKNGVFFAQQFVDPPWPPPQGVQPPVAVFTDHYVGPLPPWYRAEVVWSGGSVSCSNTGALLGCLAETQKGAGNIWTVRIYTHYGNASGSYGNPPSSRTFSTDAAGNATLTVTDPPVGSAEPITIGAASCQAIYPFG